MSSRLDFHAGESLYIPVYTAIVSLLALTLHAILALTPVKSALRRHENTGVDEDQRSASPENVVVAKLSGCVVLVFIQGASFYRAGWVHGQVPSPASVELLSLGSVYIYASLLASLTTFATKRWQKIASSHLDVLLGVTFAVYMYRDVWPLATLDGIPQDRKDGWLAVARLVVLGAISVLLPLVAQPSGNTTLEDKTSPEETASTLSLITYSFLDPLIALAGRIPHLSYDLLPPLARADDVQRLKTAHFARLDTFTDAKKPHPHIFFPLMRIFRGEYAQMVFFCIVQVISSFGSPIAINRLLSGIENEGSDTGHKIRPWLWIFLLLAAPTISSIASQWHKFIYNGVGIQGEAMLTELIFEHSLRVRVVAEASESSPDSESTMSPPTRNLRGLISNLISIDLQNIVNAGGTLPLLVAYVLQSTLSVWFLYSVLGWAALVGLGTTVAVFPLPGYIGGRIRYVQTGLMQRTDGRVQSVMDTLGVLRMVKLFAWEKKTEERIAKAREEELQWLWKSRALQLFIATVNFTIPVLTMMSTFAAYVRLSHSFTVVMKQELNASIVFSSITVFDMFRSQLHEFFATLTTLVTGRVSLDRLNNFFHETELIDTYSKLSTPALAQDHSTTEIGFKNASFSWEESSSSASVASSTRKFVLRVNGQLIFKKNCINLIVGPTGSGKTSLLMALLGEMHFTSESPDAWFNLPREGGVAYAAQQSWVQNKTIRENILFNTPFDASRYRKVIYQCALEQDLAMFAAGDQQDIGEGGVTLSGGQRARVTLARAVYSRAEVLLLDDVLAALDVQTANWIVEKCFQGDLIQGRTVLLVTHNIALTRTIADCVISIGSDGRVVSQGSLRDALESNAALVSEIVQAEREPHDEAVHAVPEPDTGKLIVAEEIEFGRVSWKAVKLYGSALGGAHPALFFIPLMLCMFTTDSLINFRTWYLGYFASQYENRDKSEVDVAYYMSIYGGILALTLFIYCASSLIYLFGMVRASTVIHDQLIRSILGTAMRFLDTTPASRIVARCTQDLRAVDAEIGQSLWNVVDIVFYAGVRLVVVFVLAPPFILPAAVLLVAGVWIGSVYTRAQISVKREMSNARAPILGQRVFSSTFEPAFTDRGCSIGVAIDGLVSIRAYSAQESFILTSLTHINHLSRTTRAFQNLSRWIAVRMDLLGTVFVVLLAVYMVYFEDRGSSVVGFSLNMASGVGLTIMFGVSMVNQLEIQSNSLERIKQYLDIEQEDKPTAGGVPPAYWPSSGHLRAENLSARYSADGPAVLKGVSFDIKTGERVGIVGRTGSGKSSLTLALLRAILTEGEVYYDGMRTSQMNLDALRRNITIIPQLPELLSGSLRFNLDPDGEHDDAALNDALRAAGLFSLDLDAEAAGGAKKKITLDTVVASGGANFSVGQRQVIALSRALVRRSKVLVLDEATSAIDYETDRVIQESLRTQLGKDVTVLCVAHRLQSVMDADRIIVLDGGRIAEFDTPRRLISKGGGLLRALVDESQDKDALLAQLKAT
ncbi:P-loop containing nucleoside triphosphate hydrolase protein [Mycena amicta]|nr:P-loop containing nucleoside triphosphate hydrolase protein [Mycena amicta]